jgi:hypothetical protein
MPAFWRGFVHPRTLLPGRTLPLEGLMLPRIEVVGVESLHMWQQRLGKATTFGLVIG